MQSGFRQMERHRLLRAIQERTITKFFFKTPPPSCHHTHTRSPHPPPATLPPRTLPSCPLPPSPRHLHHHFPLPFSTSSTRPLPPLPSAHEKAQEKDWKRVWRSPRSPTSTCLISGNMGKGGLHLDTGPLEAFVLFPMPYCWWGLGSKNQKFKKIKCLSGGLFHAPSHSIHTGATKPVMMNHYPPVFMKIQQNGIPQSPSPRKCSTGSD